MELSSNQLDSYGPYKRLMDEAHRVVCKGVKGLAYSRVQMDLMTKVWEAVWLEAYGTISDETNMVLHGRRRG